MTIHTYSLPWDGAGRREVWCRWWYNYRNRATHCPCCNVHRSKQRCRGMWPHHMTVFNLHIFPDNTVWFFISIFPFVAVKRTSGRRYGSFCSSSWNSCFSVRPWRSYLFKISALYGEARLWELLHLFLKSDKCNVSGNVFYFPNATVK